MARRKFTHHGAKRRVKKQLSAVASGTASRDVSAEAAEMISISTGACCSATVTLNITDAYDGYSGVVHVNSQDACDALTLKVNGTAVSAVSSTSFTANDVNVIYVDVVTAEEGSVVATAHFRVI